MSGLKVNEQEKQHAPSYTTSVFLNNSLPNVLKLCHPS